MSVLVNIHLVISAVLLLLVFVEGRDEPFWMRLASAVTVALLWLPLLSLCIVFVATDWIGDRLKARRK